MYNVRQLFKARDLFFHDGVSMKRVTLSKRLQVAAAGTFAAALLCGAAGVASVAITAPAVSLSLSDYAAKHRAVSAMEARVAQLQHEVDMVKADARLHASKLAARQAAMESIIKGSSDPKSLAAAFDADVNEHKGASADVLASFRPVEQKQIAAAAQVRSITEERYRKTAMQISQLGIDPSRFQPAMGGPYEPVATANVQASATTQPVVVSGAAPLSVQPASDPQFKALFNAWKRLDQLQQGAVSIPSQKPVQSMSLTSGYGVRSDPFRGTAAMHAGVDIPGPYGTPIYATADATVVRTERAGGYGNLVELDHGRGIVTRYGHLSAFATTPGARVKRGQLIAYMGSTGRSTGNHLHYEVRIDGRAVNPIPFLRSNDYLIAMQQRTQNANVAMGGPAKNQ